MNLDIIVRPEGNGRYIVACPNFPECETEGSSVEEALDLMAEKITDMLTDNIRTNIKATLKDVSTSVSLNGPIDAPVLMTKLPICLN